MFALTANKVHLRLSARELLTSGSQNIYICQFTFSSDWDGIDRLAVFQAGGLERSIILDEDNECQIPHEVLASPGKELFVGVYGTRNGEVVMPTILASLGAIHKGTNSAESAKDPTPGIYEQILDIAREAKETADSVREDADEGKFQGPAGKGFPPGGITGQVLVKKSDADYDTQWLHVSGGGMPNELGHAPGLRWSGKAVCSRGRGTGTGQHPSHYLRCRGGIHWQYRCNFADYLIGRIKNEHFN